MNADHCRSSPISQTEKVSDRCPTYKTEFNLGPVVIIPGNSTKARHTSSMSEESATKIAKAAKAAFEASQLIDTSERVKALHLIKSELEAVKEDIQRANKEDLEVRTHSSCIYPR